MIIVCTASSDTYITNKIVNEKFRATDANVGRAGTLDLFKLYNETSLMGVTGQDEISRILVRFDLQPLQDLTSSLLDLNSSNFKAYLQMFDVSGGSATPSNFNLVAFPLSMSFDEGIGRDVSSFNDLDRANFITASYTNGANTLWFASGANAGGLLGSSNIDYISSGNLGSGIVNLYAAQNFSKGIEDLSVDVTTIVSATLAGKIANNGFRLSFSGSDESDTKTRFVKRFASRQSANPLLRPKLFVRFDTSLQDNSNNFSFDSSGSIFLQNFNGSSLTNILSGSALTPVTGNNCLLFSLVTGSFTFNVTGSQHRSGTGKNFVTGLYSASFALDSSNSSLVNSTETLSKFIEASGSVTFKTFWSSLDKTFGYHTGSLTINRPERVQSDFTSRRPMINVVNVDPYYTSKDLVKFRLFGVDLDKQFNQPVKRRRILKSVIYENVYYQIFDRFSGNVVIPYDKVNNSTKVSIDSMGMFFDFNMQALIPGRSYGFQFLIVERDQSYLSQENEACFDVRP